MLAVREAYDQVIEKTVASHLQQTHEKKFKSAKLNESILYGLQSGVSIFVS